MIWAWHPRSRFHTLQHWLRSLWLQPYFSIRLTTSRPTAYLPVTPSVERWPAILLQLQDNGWQRAVDLAHALSVSPRTIYRDMQALEEAGVPLRAVPGKGYQLEGDYLLNPVALTVDEAVMLVLGSAFAAQNFDGVYQASARSAHHKLTQQLPEDRREHARSLESGVHLVPASAFGNPTEERLLRTLRRALLEERTVQVHGTEHAASPYLFDPYGLVRQGPTWYVVGYAHADERVRHVRLDRMANLDVHPSTFKRPSGYRTAPGIRQSLPERPVRVLFSSEVAASVQAPPYIHVASTEQRTDGLFMTVHVHHEQEVLPWLLSWGAHVRVLHPPALQRRIAGEARRMAAQYRTDPMLMD